VAYLVAWALIPAEPGTAPVTRRRLLRSYDDRKIAGVCGGLATYFGVDATPVRLAWALLTIIPVAVIPGGIICGVLAYLVAWFIVPAEPAPAWEASPPPA
jgi:phage shock protein PspC (stress-responsive transcriptional regulator)